MGGWGLSQVYGTVLGDTHVCAVVPAGATSIVSPCFAPGPIRLRWWRQQTPTHAAQQVINSSTSSSRLVAINIMSAFLLVGHQAPWGLLGTTLLVPGHAESPYCSNSQLAEVGQVRCAGENALCPLHISDA